MIDFVSILQYSVLGVFFVSVADTDPVGSGIYFTSLDPAPTIYIRVKTKFPFSKAVKKTY